MRPATDHRSPREPLPTRFQDLPALPDAAESALDVGLRALDLELDAAMRAAITGHLRLLLAWTGSINLTAIRDPVEAVMLHVLDSLAAVRLVREAGAGRLLDLGSGGGYPGIPLAVAAPAGALLVESVGKKARFLDVAIGALGLAPRVGVAPVRGEALAARADQRGCWPVVTARAVASLADLVELAFPLLEPGGRLIAWKRVPLDDELVPARRAALELGRGHLWVEAIGLAGLAGHVLVVVEKTAPTPDGFPRDPAVRRRRPW